MAPVKFTSCILASFKITFDRSEYDKLAPISIAPVKSNFFKSKYDKSSPVRFKLLFPMAINCISSFLSKSAILLHFFTKSKLHL